MLEGEDLELMSEVLRDVGRTLSCRMNGIRLANLEVYRHVAFTLRVCGGQYFVNLDGKVAYVS